MVIVISEATYEPGFYGKVLQKYCKGVPIKGRISGNFPQNFKTIPLPRSKSERMQWAIDLCDGGGKIEKGTDNFYQSKVASPK